MSEIEELSCNSQACRICDAETGMFLVMDDEILGLRIS
jgi:hypothetical protein